jgi:WD40 repeat protein
MEEVVSARDSTGDRVSPAAGDGDDPRRFDVFLSHNSRDKPLVERIAERLKRAGLEPWLDAWRLVPGANWQRGLAQGLAASRSCAVFVGPDDLGAWANQEVMVALDRAASDPDFRLFLVLLPGLPEQFESAGLSPFLRMRTWVDFRRGLDDTRAFERLVAAVKGLAPGPDVQIEAGDDVSPYRGLEVFEEEHAEFFFGREGDVQRLLEELKGSRFLAVLGASGSGKSSLVRAGLIPALRATAPPWEVVLMRPGARPLESLAARLVALGGGAAMQKTLDALTGDPRSLHLAASLALVERPAGSRVLFVVDQFEEVFTLCHDDTERRAFFANLLYGATIPDGPSGVLLTMRADFYHRCGAYPELAQQLAASQYLVSPLQSDGLRQAIEEPARRVGLAFEPGLAATILEDVTAQPGALPLLEHALLELWERRSGGLLTLDGYRESGGVEGAIAKRADEVFDSLTPPAQELARRTFLRLTQPGEGTEDTRRRAQLAELEGADAVNRLVQARLLTTSRDDEAGGEMVEVAHEALIRGWPRLRAWIDEDRAGLVVHRRLTDAAYEWERLGRDPGALYRGAPLTTALEWRKENEDELNDVEREFVDTSRQLEQRSARWRRALVIALALLAVAATTAAVWAVFQTRQANTQKREAQRQSRTALSRALAAEAPLHLRNELDLASLLAVQSYRVSSTPEARSALTRLVAATARISAIRLGDYTSAAFSPDERVLALGTGTGSIRLWNLRAQHFVGRSVRVPGAEVGQLAFSGDGATLAAVHGSQLIIWRVTQGQKLRRRAKAPFPAAGGLSGALGVDERGEHVVTVWEQSDVGLSNPLVEWRVGDAKPDVLVQADFGASARFAHRGRSIVAVADGVARVFRTRRQGVAPVSSVRLGKDCCTRSAVADDGRLVAAETIQGRVVVWSVAERRIIRTYPAPAASGYGMAIAPANDRLALGGYTGTAAVYDLRRPRKPPDVLFGRRGSVNVVALGHAGGFVSVDNRGAAIIWQLRGSVARPVGPALLRALTDGGAADGVEALRLRLAASPAFRKLDVDSAQLELSPKGTTFALVPDILEPRVIVGDARRLTRLHTLVHPGEVSPAFEYMDDATLVTGGADVRFWNPRTGQQTRVLRRDGNDLINSWAFTRDRKWLVAGFESGDVVVWELKNDDPRLARRGHNDFAIVAVAPDGRTFASGGREGTVKLWDLASGRELGEPIVVDDPVEALAFDERGGLAAMMKDEKSGTNSFAAWDSLLWTDGRALDRLCRVAGRNLTIDEWRQYIPDQPPGATCPGYPHGRRQSDVNRG